MSAQDNAAKKCCNIPIFVPHYGCPYDCVFCNQRHITGEKEIVDAKRVHSIIEEQLLTIDHKKRRIEAAFFGGSFTAICPSVQEELLGAAYEYVRDGRIDGIRLSTRPDYIDDDIMKRLVKYGVTAVELGVQSMDDEVLAASGRGHRAEDAEKAVGIIRKYPVELGLQMMTGLPCDTDEKSIKTAEKIIALEPDCVRIYPTLVIRDTKLEKMYNRGKYQPQELDSAVRLAARLLEMFRENNIRVIRVGLAATDEISPGGALVAGPYHSAFGELAEGEIYYERIIKALGTDKYGEFKVCTRELSKVYGNGKRNIKRLEKKGIKIRIIPDQLTPKGKIVRVL